MIFKTNKYSNFVLLFLLFLSSFALAEDDKIIVQVNERKIGFQEFRSRLNSLPKISNYSSDETKENLLCSLIAEAILSFEASSGKQDTSEQIKLLSKQYHNEALYEQWMNSEVRSKIQIDDKELQSAYLRFREQRLVEYWILPNETEAKNFVEEILKGTSETQKPQTKELEYGESLEYVEDVIYNLNIGETSDPLLIDSVYYIFRLKKTESHHEYSSHNFAYWAPIIERKLRARKEMALVDDRIHNLMDDKKFSVNKEAYNILLNQLYLTIYDEEKLKFDSPELIQQEIGSKEIKSQTNSNKSLVEFNDGDEWTINEFWQKLSVCPFPLNYKSPADLKIGLFDVIKKIILSESVAEDAKNKGYDTNYYVKYQTEMWNLNLKAQVIIENFRNSISLNESDLIQHYDSTKSNYISPELRKIIPIVVKEEKLASQLHNQILEGNDITTLARQHSIANSMVDKNDLGVYITSGSWGEIGIAAFNLQPNEISQVIKIGDSSFAIIKLLEIKKAAPYPFEEVRNHVYSDLEDRILQQKLTEILSSVSKNYKIKIDREELKKIPYPGANMSVKKTHFPLRMSVPGFPFFNHKSKWFQEVLQNSDF